MARPADVQVTATQPSYCLGMLSWKAKTPEPLDLACHVCMSAATLHPQALISRLQTNNAKLETRSVLATRSVLSWSSINDLEAEIPMETQHVNSGHNYKSFHRAFIGARTEAFRKNTEP